MFAGAWHLLIASRMHVYGRVEFGGLRFLLYILPVLLCCRAGIGQRTALDWARRSGHTSCTAPSFSCLPVNDWAGTMLSSLHDRGPARSSSGYWWYTDTPCALIHARGACVREEHLSAVPGNGPQHISNSTISPTAENTIQQHGTHMKYSFWMSG
jgi:hypothetical protein